MLVEEFNSKVIYLNKNVVTEITKKKKKKISQGMIPPLIQSVVFLIGSKTVVPFFCLPKMYVSYLCHVEKLAFHSSLQNNFSKCSSSETGSIYRETKCVPESQS